MPEIERDDATLHYETRGLEANPAVVFLHGFTSDLRSWHYQLGQLEHEYFLIALDMRGHGLSRTEEGADFSIETFASDVGALLDNLALERCALVGCSFGGMVALQFAVEHPERVAALAVTDTSPAPDHERYTDAFREREARIAEEVRIAATYGTAELGKRVAKRLRDPFLARAARERYARMGTQGFVGGARARRERPNLVPRLTERLTMPVLACWGEEDAVVCAREVMADELPGARIVTFRRTGHGVPMLREQDFTGALKEFLHDVEAGRPVAATVEI